MAGVAGFEPTNAAVKVLCLTAWRHPRVWEIAIFKEKESPLTNLLWACAPCTSASKLILFTPIHVSTCQRGLSFWAQFNSYLHGGEWGIWTLGAFTPDSFQDCCIKPLCQLSIKLRDISTASIPSRWAPLYIPEEGRGIQLKCLWRNGRDSNPRTRNLA